MVDFDVYDLGNAAGGSRGLYFQRHDASPSDSDTWQTVADAAIRGGLDERCSTDRVVIGAIASGGSLWLYRFGSKNLRDGFGRLGRVIVVLVRSDGQPRLDARGMSKFLGAADALHGIPLDLSRLAPDTRHEPAVVAVQERVRALVERWQQALSILRDGNHVGLILASEDAAPEFIDLPGLEPPVRRPPAPPAQPRPVRSPGESKDGLHSHTRIDRMRLLIVGLLICAAIALIALKVWLNTSPDEEEKPDATGPEPKPPVAIEPPKPVAPSTPSEPAGPGEGKPPDQHTEQPK